MTDMLAPLDRRPRRSGCFWWLLVLAIALAATAAVLRPYFAFGVSRPPQDHIAVLNGLLAQHAAVAPPDRAKPNAPSELLARAVELTYQAHEQVLGVPITREFSPKWRLGFDGQTLTATEQSVLAAAEKLGVFSTLDDLPDRRAPYAPFAEGATPQVVLDQILLIHSAMRQMARMNVVRLRAALVAGDGPAAARALAENAALGRAAADRPFALSRLLAITILSAGHEELARAARAGRLPAAALPDLARTLAQPDLPPPAFLLETERQFVHLSLDHSLGWSPLRSINRDAVKNTVDELFDQFARLAALPTFAERQAQFHAAAPAFAALCARSPLLSSLDHSLPDMILRVERDFDERASIARTGIAIERFRLEKGSLPASLAQLVPAYLPVLPTRPEGDQLPFEVGGPTPPGYRLGPPPAAPASPEASGPPSGVSPGASESR